MRMPAALCAAIAGPAMAEVVTCDLSGVPIRFQIDLSQFAPALDPGEPMRRRITTVQMGDTQFPAEPILMGNVRGFWAEGMGGSEIMMVMQGDGSAIYADTAAGRRLTGTCEVLQ